MKTNVKKIAGLSSLVLMVTALFAGCTMAPAEGTATNASAAGSMTQSLVMIVLLFAVFYFMMIRPEKKRKKKTEDMRSSLSVGDKITTIGGMTGKIVGISADTITFETGEDRVRIEIAKWGISRKD